MEIFGLLKARKRNKNIKPLHIHKIEESSECMSQLRQTSEDVSLPLSEEDTSLLDSMEARLFKLGGVGLAAPQVGVHKRLAVIYIPPAVAKHGIEPQPMHEIINPTYEPIGDGKCTGTEGCYSVDSVTGEVPRYNNIRLFYQDRAGLNFVKEAKGFYAGVLQHEIDHLNGVLFLDRMYLHDINFKDYGHLLLT